MKLSTKTLNMMFSAALVVAVPSIGRSAALAVNGTCVVGTCTAPGNLTSGQSISGTIPYTLTLADGDKYSISAAYSASYSTSAGGTIFVNPIVTYIGTAASVAVDSVSVDFYENYFDNSPGSYDGTFGETIPFNGIPAGSTANGQLIVDGQSIGLLSFTGTGSTTLAKSTILTGLTDPTLTLDYNFGFTFAAGLPPGTTVSSPSGIPEPAETIPAALALGGFALVALRRRKQ